MKAKFIAQVLLGAVMFTGAFAPQAHAGQQAGTYSSTQSGTYSGTYTGSYSGSYESSYGVASSGSCGNSSSSPCSGGSYSNQPIVACDTSNPHLPKTVSTRTGRALFVWTTTLGDWDPLSRCQAVTDRLNNQAKKNGGTLKGLIFNVGTVNTQTVVCVTSASQPRCNSSNLIFTMKPENAYNAGEVIDQLRNRIEGLASGRPVIESEAKKGVDAGQF
ncbi:COP23 domain-containing protein [Kamptonema formosum]|uniref:COP23 domain-containing protein n=1 Tax=Kamptonema formosum TaxID=331992 RepID=UPI0003475E75|nr:COP23 domain-containing protein [Oscillatoria sp. PCC 10802]